MLSISHALTGAFLATKIGQPVVFVPAIVASHYLEDWIPHWDVGTGLSSSKRARSTAIWLELGELAITGVLMYVFWQHGQSQIVWLAWIGAFIGLLPDFLEAPRNFLHAEPALFRPLNALHGRFHHSTSHIFFGLLPQILVVALIYWIK